MPSTKESFHCIYFSLQQAINKISDLNINESMICQLFKRYGFRYEVNPDSHFPSYEILENKFNFYLFKELTGIEIDFDIERDDDSAFHTTLHTLEQEGFQLVMANTFYLSFDPKNYRQSNDEHMVMLHSYDEKNAMFTVSDYHYHYVQISKDDLMKARKKQEDNLFYSYTIKKSEDVSREELIENVLNSMLINVTTYLNRDFSYVESLKNELIHIHHQEGIFAKLGWEYLTKTLYHPKGPIKSRALMAQSCLLVNNDLYTEFQSLSKGWSSFVKEIVRFSQAGTDFDRLLKIYDDIIALEYKLHSSLKEELTLKIKS